MSSDSPREFFRKFLIESYTGRLVFNLNKGRPDTLVHELAEQMAQDRLDELTDEEIQERVDSLVGAPPRSFDLRKFITRRK